MTPAVRNRGNRGISYAEVKHRKVLGIAAVLIDEYGYASAGRIRRVAELLGDDPERWDPNTPAAMTIRNSLNALVRRGLLVQSDKSYPELRWTWT